MRDVALTRRREAEAPHPSVRAEEMGFFVPLVVMSNSGDTQQLRPLTRRRMQHPDPEGTPAPRPVHPGEEAPACAPCEGGDSRPDEAVPPPDPGLAKRKIFLLLALAIFLAQAAGAALPMPASFADGDGAFERPWPALVDADRFHRGPAASGALQPAPTAMGPGRRDPHEAAFCPWCMIEVRLEFCLQPLAIRARVNAMPVPKLDITPRFLGGLLRVVCVHSRLLRAEGWRRPGDGSRGAREGVRPCPAASHSRSCANERKE